jgi:hypothetical protein
LALADSGARILFFSPGCAGAATAAAALVAGMSPIELNRDAVDDLTEDFAGR